MLNLSDEQLAAFQAAMKKGLKKKQKIVYWS